MTSRHILIIDDSPEDRADIRSTLLRGSAQRYRFSEAINGAAGVKACSAPNDLPDCVVLDYHLPDMNAPEVLVELCRGTPLTICPVLVLTGANALPGAGLLRAGAQDYLGKGWSSPESLTRAVENSIDRFALLLERDRMEEKLRRSEKQLRLAREATSLISFEWDIQRDEVRRFHSNDPALSATPIDQPSTLAAVMAAVYSEDRDRFSAGIAAALGHPDGRYENQFRIVHPDGAIVWLDEVGRVERDAEGKPALLMGISQDITQRKGRELNTRFLADLQTFFAPLSSSAEIMRVAGEGIVEHLGLSHCIFEEMNESEDLVSERYDHHAVEAPSFARAYATKDFYTATERRDRVAGRVVRINDVLHPPRSEEQSTQFTTLGIGSLMAASYTANKRCKFVLTALRSTRSVWTQSDGEFLSELAARIYPRIERARAEEKLRDSEERFSRAQRAARIGTWDWNLVTGAYSWTEEAWAVFGRNVGEMTVSHENWLACLHPDDRFAALTAIEKARESGNYRDEYRVLAPDGRVRWVESRGEVLFDTSALPVRMVGTALDITDRKESELKLSEARKELLLRAADLENVVAERTVKLRETIWELEAFSYSMIHDMRAPLRAMQGFSRALLADFPALFDVTAQHYLERIEAAGRRMDSFIVDILSYSKVVRGHFELRAVPLEALLREVIAERPGLHADHVDLMIETPLPVIWGNESATVQMFSNLIENAVKFVAPNVRPRIRIYSEKRLDKVRVWVEDNGIGIPREAQSQLFKIFGSLNAPGHDDGTGIGLAIVRKVAERMGGTVGVESEPGMGSKFWVELNLFAPS